MAGKLVRFVKGSSEVLFTAFTTASASESWEYDKKAEHHGVVAA
jgi:hypothetical protein